MKEKKDCKIVQDLLPNYIEKLTAEETNAYIEEHINNCKDCKNIFEDMSKKIENVDKKLDRREINYAKKINRRIKLLRVFFIFILLIAILFVINIINNYAIIKRFEKMGYSNLPTDNYIYRYSTYSENNMLNSTEYYIKNNKSLEKSMSALIGSGSNMYNLDIYYKDLDKREFIAVHDGKTELVEMNSEPLDRYRIPIFADDIKNLSEWEKLKYAITSKIKTDYLNSSECYLIENSFGKIWVEKSTGAILKEEYEPYTSNSTYQYNCISDNMMERPDTTDFE